MGVTSGTGWGDGGRGKRERERGGGKRDRNRVYISELSVASMIIPTQIDMDGMVLLKAKRGQRTTHFLSLSWSMYSLS